MKHTIWSGTGTVLAGLTLVGLALLLLRVIPAQAAPDPTIHCVNHTGAGCQGDCGSCHSSVQAAINAAGVGHEVRLAGGTYAPGSTVAVITKELSLRGGFSTDFAVFDPDVYESVLDAGWTGSVISISNASDVYLQHLKITHGAGTGNCGTYGCGGGVYAWRTDLHIDGCTVVDNAATAYGGGNGGGVYASALSHSVQIWDSRITENVASPNAGGDSQYGNGGGVLIHQGEVDIWRSEIDNNVGSVIYGGTGGLHLINVDSARVTTNTIHNNKACLGAYWCSAGGIYVENSSGVYVAANHIEDNRAASEAGYGGGIYVYHSDAWVDGNWIISNTTGLTGHGGGVSIFSTQPVTVSNNVIAGNYAGDQGGGVCVWRLAAPGPGSLAVLVNNTIVDNGDTGVVASEYATITLQNNIMAGHVLGLSEHSAQEVVINADTNLFWNDTDPVVGSNSILADPMLSPGYRLVEGSPALDAGLNVAWLTEDIAGHPRPWNAYDLGAYEGVAQLQYLPLVLRD